MDAVIHSWFSDWGTSEDKRGRQLSCLNQIIQKRTWFTDDKNRQVQTEIKRKLNDDDGKRKLLKNNK